MNISRINSNFNFNAKINGKLKKEIQQKQNKCKMVSDCKKFKPVLDKAIKNIKNFPSNWKVNIDKEDSSLYNINVWGANWKYPRGNDKDSYDYCKLITALSDIYYK